MKKFLLFVSIVSLASIILSACAGSAEPSATAVPAASEPPAAVTEAPAATEPPVVATVDTAPTLRTIDIGGPVMEVGAHYPYVDGTVLVGVPSGPFTMGYNSVDNPVHEVTLSEFWIYSTKVTNQQYALCVQSGKCSPPDPVNGQTFNNYRFINYPVTGVNYDQAAAYCTFVHGRLPTEAEWEKTARGPDANLFPWGNTAPQCDLLNYKFCEGKTSLVTKYKKGVSYYSAYDMSGNAREWVADWYSPTYYTESGAAADPLGPALGEKRSVRGSSYQDSADPSISAHRFSLKPTETLPDLGFRCVVQDPTYFAPSCTQIAYIGTGPNGEEANCTPEVKCNDVNITQAPNCTGAPTWQKYTIVTFDLAGTPPDNWAREAPGCSLLGGGTPTQEKYQCDPGAVGPLKVYGYCIDTKSCVSACPEHYNKVGDVCQWDGSGTTGTECLPGMTYDPLTQCCSATPGVGVDFNLCPVGFYRVGDTCVLSPVTVSETIVQDVIFTDKCSPPVVNTCDPKTDPNCPEPQSCTVPLGICGQYGGAADPINCCCRYPAGPTAGPYACP